MKKIILAMLLLCSIPAMSQVESATLTASGLTCSMCSKAIYKALTKVSFVKNVVPDVEKSSYKIEFKENTPIVWDEIKNAVQNAGFSVASMQVTALFNNEEVYDDAHVVIGGNSFHFIHTGTQKLQGEKTFTIIDKNYLPAADYRKYSKLTTMKCYETGIMSSCCPKEQATPNRIYHATL